MEKFLYFAQTATDALAIPVSGIVAIDIVDADTVQFYYKEITDAAGGSVLVDITSGYNKQFISGLLKAIKSSREEMIVVADDVNSEYFSTKLDGTTVAATNCGTIALT